MTFIVTSATGEMPVRYGPIFNEFAHNLPDVASHVVFHNSDRYVRPDPTVNKLNKRAARLFRDMDGRRLHAFTEEVSEAIKMGDPQTYAHRNLICVIPQPKNCDKVARLSDFFGMAVTPQDAEHLWPAFLDFTTRMLLGMAAYVHEYRAHNEKWTVKDDACVATSDGFAVLWQIKTHGNIIVPFAEQTAQGRMTCNKQYYRTEYALRRAYEFGTSAEGQEWLRTAKLPDIYNKAREIWNTKPTPAGSIDRETIIRNKLLAAAAALDSQLSITH